MGAGHLAGGTIAIRLNRCVLTFKQFTESWLDISHGHDLTATGPSSGFVIVNKLGDANDGKYARVIRRQGSECAIEYWDRAKDKPLTSMGSHWYHASQLKPVAPGPAKKFGRTRTPAGDLR